VSPSTGGKSRAEQVAGDLEAEMLRQQQPVGTRLGLRTDLITRFNVSPGIVNEALRLLRGRGLITVKPGPNGGVFVADMPPGVRLYELDLWFQQLSVSPLEVFESRVLLDDLFYVLALERATRDDLRVAERGLHTMEDGTADARTFFEGIMEFHLAIARAAHVTVLLSLYESMATVLLSSLVRATFREEPAAACELSVQMHRELFEAIRAQDRARLQRAVQAHRTGLISPLEPERSPVSDRTSEHGRSFDVGSSSRAS
jgi:DNA-binding FadR family transcriptional regulator